MKHTVRIKRHVIEVLLASTAGATLMDALYRRSWISLVFSIINGIALFVEEKADIEEEEE